MIAPNGPGRPNPFRLRAEPNAETLTPEQLGPRHVGVREPFPTLESTYAHTVVEPEASEGETGATTADGWQLGTCPGTVVPAAPIARSGSTTLRDSLRLMSGWWSVRPSFGRPPLLATAIAYVKANEFFVVTGLAGLILCYALIAGPLAPQRRSSLAVSRPVPKAALTSAPAARVEGVVLGASSPSEATEAKPSEGKIAGSAKALAAGASEPRERRPRTAPTPRARVKAAAAVAATTTSRTAKTETPVPAAPPKPADSETVESAKRELEAVSHELSATL